VTLCAYSVNLCATTNNLEQVLNRLLIYLNLTNMKKISRLLALSTMMLIMTISAEKVMSQEDPPWFMDQHGYNGDQSPQGVPLDGGSEVLFVLGIVYAARKVSEMRRKNKITR
jgi:hypothetical protein